MTLRNEMAADLALVSRGDAEEAWAYTEEADAAIKVLAEHLARQPEHGLNPAATIEQLRARLALAEARADMLERFRAQDEAGERAFHDRVEKLVHGSGTLETTVARLRSAAENAADALWWLATRVVELERKRQVGRND